MSKYRDYAEKYFNLGLRPTSISYLKTEYNTTETNPEKAPCHSWRRWQVRSPELNEIINLPWQNSSGIGTVLGHGSRCVDIDNCNDIELIKEFLKILHLPEWYDWVVKTPNGFHIHIISENLPILSNNELNEGVLALLPNDTYKNKFKRMEMRWANHAVLPPTVINGYSYDFVFLKDNALPKEKPKKIYIPDLFHLMAKYCGYTNNKDIYYDIRWSVKINDFFFDGCIDSSMYAFSSGISKLDSNNVPLKIKDISIGYINGENYWDILEKVLFIDTETTGLIKDPLNYETYPRLIQIAHNYGIIYDNIKNIYIKPNNFIIPQEIEDLTGITNSFAVENGSTIHSALNSFISKRKFNPIVGYNIDFDLSIIDSEFIRLQKNNSLTIIKPLNESKTSFEYDSVSENYLRDGSQVFCLMKKINSIFSGKYLKLSEAYEKLFLETVPLQLHDAINDLEIMIDCFNLLVLYGYIGVSEDGKKLV